VDCLRQALHAAADAAAELRGTSSLERELGRAHGKLNELQAQKALKLLSFVTMSKRVTHPYVYPSGEVSAVPPIGHLPDPERVALV